MASVFSNSPTKTDQNPFSDLVLIKLLQKSKFPVYLVQSRSSKKQYALKVFPFVDGKVSQFYHNEATFSTFMHPNIIAIHQAVNEKNSLKNGKNQKISYLVMEYAPYGDFLQLLSNKKFPLDETVIRTYFHQLIDALEYLHSRGAAHLDIKPENLLLGEDLLLKVADFDMAYLEGDDEIKGSGTKYYRAPELLSGKIFDPKAADIFSAGIILFLLKSGGQLPQTEEIAFKGKNLWEMMQSDVKKFWEFQCEIQNKDAEYYSEEFRELFCGMTKMNPADRWTIKQIRKSNWFNGPVLSDEQLKEYMLKNLA